MYIDESVWRGSKFFYLRDGVSSRTYTLVINKNKQINSKIGLLKLYKKTKISIN